MPQQQDERRPRLEFWFEFGSTYSYLSVMRIEQLAQQAGVALDWRPFLLGPVLRELGWNSSPFVLQPEKGRYMWHDLAREARKYHLAFARPSVFPRAALRPMRVALLGARQPWIGAFCRQVMLQNFVHDQDIDDPDSVRRALHGLVPDPEPILAAADSPEHKLRLRAQTAEARRRGIFGAPTFFSGTEMFWGNDRLDDAIAAARQAGAGGQ